MHHLLPKYSNLVLARHATSRNNKISFNDYKRFFATVPHSIKKTYFESANDLPNEAKVIIYGDELVSKSLAYHLSNSIGDNVLVIRGNGTQNGKRIRNFHPDLNSFYLNHLNVSNPRSSLLIRHSTELFNMTNCGAIYLAQTEERVKSFKRMISISKLFIPKECGSIELLSPEGIK